MLSSDYDYSQATCDNHRAQTRLACTGPFADIRASLDFSYHGCYTKARQAFQDSLVNNVIEQASSHEHPWLVFTAGAMGAGKSHVMRWMVENGHFPLADIVYVDPDRFREALPEWLGYRVRDPATAGELTHRESGYLVEIATEASLRASKNVWVDGSLRDTQWYEQFFAFVRRAHPQYRIAIFEVKASWESVCRRVAQRAGQTGRVVPMHVLQDSFEKVPASVARLRRLADLYIGVANDSKPTLQIQQVVRVFPSDARKDWTVVRNQFATVPARISKL